MFGSPQKIGLKDSLIPESVISSIETEEELEEFFVSQGGIGKQ